MLKDLVLRILNQTVGEYFENIDASQLQLSVFSGNIVLQDLILKRNVCENLGLPFRVLAGRCAKLIVKIPWTTGLSSYPVEVDIQHLYLLIVPGSSVPYDEEAEEKVRLRLKLQLLENIEAAQKEFTENANATELAEPGYFEKKAMQIVRNLQIRMQSIHIRYEDEETHPDKSFAFGAVLKNLSISTTDGNWVPRYVYDNVATVFKLLQLEGFALYWDCNTLMVSKTETDMIARLELLQEMLRIATFDNLVGPISIVAKLQLNINPEKGPNPFTVPKLMFDTFVEELVIGISNLQFQNMLYMGAAWEGLYRKEYYKKYRPHQTPYKRNYRLWWKFAFDCIMEDIQRRRNNWRWIRMLQHRKDCKSYYMALYSKNILKRTTPQLELEIETLENRLDIFNILLIRKQVDLCRERQEKIELKLKREQSWCKWLKSWVNPVAAIEGVNSITEPLTPTEMSTEEKLSLLTAIGYTKATTCVVNSPPEYVEAHIDFRLDKLRVIVRQDDRIWNALKSISEGSKNTILDLQIFRCSLSLDYRSVNNGMKLTCNLASMVVYGGDAPYLGNGEELDKHIRRGATLPIISPRIGSCGTNFVDLIYEMSPLDSDYDQKLYIRGHPLDITYDSATVEKLTCCFTLPQHVALQRLQSTAMLTYTNLKARSSTSLKKMITGGPDGFDLDITIEAPCIIIPQNCFSSLVQSVTVVELGQLIITSQFLEARSNEMNKYAEWRQDNY